MCSIMVTRKTRSCAGFRTQHLYPLPISERPMPTLPQTFSTSSAENAQYSVHFEKAPFVKDSLVSTWFPGCIYTHNRYLLKEIWIKNVQLLNKDILIHSNLNY